MKNNLTLRRKCRNLTQKELAVMADVAPSQILRMELANSNPTVMSAKKVADALVLQIEDIWSN